MPSINELDVPSKPPDDRQENEENERLTEPGDLPRRYRSPHPYSFSKPSRRSLPVEASLSDSPTPHDSSSPTKLSDNTRGLVARSKANWTPTSATSPNESGTEADDEAYGYGLVRALPPAPLRQHKGLRRRSSDENATSRRQSDEDRRLGVSPCLTPSRLLEDDESKAPRARDYFNAKGSLSGSRRQSTRGSSTSRKDEESRAARERLRRKRRAELARRMVEFVLMGCIWLAVMGDGSVRQQISFWKRGKHLAFFEMEAWTSQIDRTAEVGSSTITILLLLGIYPVRLLWYEFKRRAQVPSMFATIKVPVAFDPAPLFYPTTIPVLVAASLSPASTKYLLPNAVLCIATLPIQLVPLSYGSGIENSLHWMLSLVPLILSENTSIPNKLASITPYRIKATTDALDSEIITCIYALHHALIVPLQFATSTSLLPAELHLLSAGLINLLVFSKSPQAIVLDVLLWFGGLALYITCGPVVRWGIALARIPKWRLRRAGKIIGTQQSIISNLNKALREKAGIQTSPIDGPHSSDSENEQIKTQPTPSLSRLQSLRAEVVNALKTNFPSFDDDATHSAVEPTAASIESLRPSDSMRSRQRRYTLPILSRVDSQNEAPATPKGKVTRRSRSSIVKYFLSLTHEQAAARKWYYAGYIWAMIISITLGPACLLVSRYALNGNEPIGWAIGYIFGNVPSIRFEIVRHDLESWIPLPSLQDATDEIPLSYRFPRYLWWIHPLMRMLGLSPGPATTRLLLVLYCAVCVLVGLTIVILLSPVMEVDTRRKVFHFTMVALLLPSVAVDPCFIALALALVLAAFLLLELLRASQLPPLSKPIAAFLAPYVDGRDYKGPVVVSHIFLLIGCAIPLWLSLAGVQRTDTPPSDAWQGWSTPERNLSMLSGVICVGLGDAFASLVGRRFGRHKWPWAGGKSLEGSLAFACAVVGGLVIGRGLLNLVLYGHLIVRTPQGAVFTVAKAAAAGLGASMMEAVLTGGNDNVIVPVVLWLLVRAVGL